MKLPRFLGNIVRADAAPELVTTRNFDEIGSVLEDYAQEIEKSNAAIADLYKSIKRVSASGISGSGAANRVAYWAAASTLAYTDNFQFTNTSGGGTNTLIEVKNLTANANANAVLKITSGSSGAKSFLNFSNTSGKDISIGFHPSASDYWGGTSGGFVMSNSSTLGTNDILRYNDVYNTFGINVPVIFSPVHSEGTIDYGFKVITGIHGSTILTQGGGSSQGCMYVAGCAGTDCTDRFTVFKVDGLIHESGGTLNNVYGIYIGQVLNAFGGSTINNYGLKIVDISFGTNKYAISTGVGLVSFGDNLQIIKSAAGSSVTSLLSNTNNSNASSHAKSDITVGGSSAGDPFTKLTVTGFTTWSYGIDNSDSDAFVIAASGALGTSNAIRIDTSLNTRLYGRMSIGSAVVSNTAVNIAGGNTLTQGGGTSQYGINLTIGSGTDCTSLFENITIAGYISVNVTDSINIHLYGGLNNGGVPTNNYGIKIEDITAGTTSNYAIYTGAGLIRFGGAASFVGGITSVASVASSFYEEGTFTATITNCTTSPTGTARYVRIGKQVTLTLPAISATCASAGGDGYLTYTGLPASLQPTNGKYCPVNSIYMGSNRATLVSNAFITNSGTIAFDLNGNPSGFVGAGTKGLATAQSISYELT